MGIEHGNPGREVYIGVDVVSGREGELGLSSDTVIGIRIVPVGVGAWAWGYGPTALTPTA